MTEDMNNHDLPSSDEASQTKDQTSAMLDYLKKREQKRDEKFEQMMSLLVTKCEALEKRFEVTLQSPMFTPQQSASKTFQTEQQTYFTQPTTRASTNFDASNLAQHTNNPDGNQESMNGQAKLNESNLDRNDNSTGVQLDSLQPPADHIPKAVENLDHLEEVKEHETTYTILRAGQKLPLDIKLQLTREQIIRERGQAIVLHELKDCGRLGDERDLKQFELDHISVSSNRNESTRWHYQQLEAKYEVIKTVNQQGADMKVVFRKTGENQGLNQDQNANLMVMKVNKNFMSRQMEYQIMVDAIGTRQEEIKKTMVQLGFEQFISDGDYMTDDWLKAMQMIAAFFKQMKISLESKPGVGKFQHDFKDFNAYYKWLESHSFNGDQVSKGRYQIWKWLRDAIWGNNNPEDGGAKVKQSQTNQAKTLRSLKIGDRNAVKCSHCPLCRKYVVNKVNDRHGYHYCFMSTLPASRFYQPLKNPDNNYFCLICDLSDKTVFSQASDYIVHLRDHSQENLSILGFDKHMLYRETTAEIQNFTEVMRYCPEGGRNFILKPLDHKLAQKGTENEEEKKRVAHLKVCGWQNIQMEVLKMLNFPYIRIDSVVPNITAPIIVRQCYNFSVRYSIKMLESYLGYTRALTDIIQILHKRGQVWDQTTNKRYSLYTVEIDQQDTIGFVFRTCRNWCTLREFIQDVTLQDFAFICNDISKEVRTLDQHGVYYTKHYAIDNWLIIGGETPFYHSVQEIFKQESEVKALNSADKVVWSECFEEYKLPNEKRKKANEKAVNFTPLSRTQTTRDPVWKLVFNVAVVIAKLTSPDPDFRYVFDNKSIYLTRTCQMYDMTEAAFQLHKWKGEKVAGTVEAIYNLMKGFTKVSKTSTKLQDLLVAADSDFVSLYGEHPEPEIERQSSQLDDDIDATILDLSKKIEGKDDLQIARKKVETMEQEQLKKKVLQNEKKQARAIQKKHQKLATGYLKIRTLQKENEDEIIRDEEADEQGASANALKPSYQDPDSVFPEGNDSKKQVDGEEVDKGK